jgi:hypothetical protein
LIRLIRKSEAAFSSC